MKKPHIFGYLLLGFTFLILFSIPPKKMHRLRASLIAKTLHLYSSSIQKKTDLTKLQGQFQLLKEENASLKTLLQTQNLIKTGNATVIFRDPAFWASSVLIDKGMQDDNLPIEKNSPILSNGYLIGVVDEVFETFSKIRLITDKNLQFSIKKKDVAISCDNEEGALEVGTIYGISSIDNRYKFRDVEGYFFSPSIKPGDALVTSGLDGIFPEGLPVAIVTDVKIQGEDVVYYFKATIQAPDIKNLKNVTILKPICAPH